MSLVTNIILTTAVDEPKECLEGVAKFCQLTPLIPIEEYSECKNNKALEADVFLIANNYGTSIGDGDDDYLTIEEALIRAIRVQDWHSPECIQLFIKRDNDDRFTEINPFAQPPMPPDKEISLKRCPTCGHKKPRPYPKPEDLESE